MRTGHRLTVFTLADRTAITTRSALETRWAIFFNELRLAWNYEPKRIGNYLPDFYVGGLGFVEIKPTLDLLIAESSNKIKSAARWLQDEKIYVFVGELVSLNTVAMYQGNEIFAPTPTQMIQIFGKLTNSVSDLVSSIYCTTSINRANRAKLDHFVSVGKIIDLDSKFEAQRKIVREASEKLKAELNL